MPWQRTIKKQIGLWLVLTWVVCINKLLVPSLMGHRNILERYIHVFFSQFALRCLGKYPHHTLLYKRTTFMSRRLLCPLSYVATRLFHRFFSTFDMEDNLEKIQLASNHTYVCKFSQLCGAKSSLTYDESLSNLTMLLILRRSCQWPRRIFHN